MSVFTESKTYSETIGDRPRKSVTAMAAALPLPVLVGTEANTILKTGHWINDSNLSGKKLGAQVLLATVGADGVATALTLYVATGPAPADKWVKVATTLTATPAA